jgi:tripartite-type tricarboxylate transporter receptor subunit TctC
MNFKEWIMVATRMAAGLVMVSSITGTAIAQQYPTKPVRVINSYAPGGPVDVTARPLLQHLSSVFGQQFLLDSRPGANGNIGAVEATRATPDGYTLLFGTTSQLTINPALYKMPFDSIRDLAPISMVSQTPSVVIVNSSYPVATLKDLIDRAKANPGKLTYSSAGNGSQNHLSGELLAMLTNTRMLHVPYKGGNPALTAVLSGEVDLIIQSPALSLPQVRAGKLKVLGVAGNRRLGILPEVPNNKELGLPEFESAAGTGVLAPAKTPRPIIDRLSAEINKYLNSDEGKQIYAKLGLDLVPGSPEEFARALQSELTRWSAVVKAANIKIQ